MDIEEVFTLKIQKLLEDNNLSVKDFAKAIEDTDTTGDGPAHRTLKGYASTSTHSKKNAGIRTLQAMSIAFQKLGIDVDEAGLITRQNEGITGENITEAVQFLAISLNDISESELEVFFDVFDKIGANNIVSASNLISTEGKQTAGYLKLAKLAKSANE